MAQQTKCLLFKHNDLSSNPQTLCRQSHHKAWNTSIGSWEQMRKIAQSSHVRYSGKCSNEQQNVPCLKQGIRGPIPNVLLPRSVCHGRQIPAFIHTDTQTDAFSHSVFLLPSKTHTDIYTHTGTHKYTNKISNLSLS